MEEKYVRFQRVHIQKHMGMGLGRMFRVWSKDESYDYIGID